MLKIQRDNDGCVSHVRLSGRIQSDQIDMIRSALADSCEHRILDLGDVSLVDIEAVQFLIRCEDEGIELVQCPPYVREWMLRERAEGTKLGYSGNV
jgi:hypothetical protein